MNLEALTQSSAWLALGAAVVHFLWQGVLIGALAALVFGTLGRRSAAARYTVACGALALCLAAFVATLLGALAEPRSADSGAPLEQLLATGSSGVEAASGSALVNISGPAAWFWAVGVLAMAVRFALQGRAARRLKSTAVSDPDPEWQRSFERLKEQLGVTRTVRLLRSGLAEVPMVVGWLSPVVLVPASAFTALSPDQLRSLLAHELAHVRRHDHLFNAVQAVVEALLFFHPVVWWISKQLREERETCCDESAVRVVGDPRSLAEALAAMELLRIGPTTSFVLAANGGPLMQRITRILGVQPESRNASTSWKLPTGLVLAGILAATGSAIASPGLTQERTSQERTAQEQAAKERAAQERAAKERAGREHGGKEHGAREHDGGERARATEAERHAELERVKAELHAGVRAGKLTQKEADERLEGYLEHVKQGDQARAEYGKVSAELDHLVRAGEITRAQADERLGAYRKHLGEGREDAARDAEMARIKRAVEAGTLTREEAGKQLKAYKRYTELAGEGQRREDPSLVLGRIEAAVAAGELTPEEGRKKIAEYKRTLAQENTAFDRRDPAATIKAIQAEVEAGKLTPAEGRAKIASIESDRAAHKHYEQLRQEIEAAVKAGKLTREQGQAKLHAYRMELAADQVVRGKDTVDGVLGRVKAAVAAGELTPEQGRELTASFKRSLAKLKQHETPTPDRVERP